MSEPVQRSLPGHIAAALAAAGGAADSADQPWLGRTLGAERKYHNFEDDDGATDAGYAAALAALGARTGDEAAVVHSLASARVFVPILAQVARAHVASNGLASDKESDMALVTLTAPDGRRALPVFTSTENLTRWNPQARPVAVYAPRAALSAVAEEAQLMVVDPAAPQTFVLRRPAVWALARQQRWLPSYADPQIASALAGSMAALGHPALLGIRAEPGAGIVSADHEGNTSPGGGAGPELRVQLTLAPGLDQDALNALIGELELLWSRNEYFAESVDSVEVRLQAAASTDRPAR
ncbi:SseB family protein [Paenarthrobacter sp. PH39-S1]|uniref:SseB family protein n=1 Tax=Paenarthrobacter sp. PH39-S1 TaxID=3046204 RepID=UPI0024B9D9E5|nr:SseB family protein [Paenarthrobacter sp. PH39-S1]MDJ0357373.1 SseB family protein [Paenarthrobacter sp. PH39-S1]